MSGAACPACENAKVDPWAGALDTNCRGCRIRYASNAPRPIRKHLLEIERVNYGDDAAESWLRDVNAEFVRRRDIKTSRA